MVNAAGLYGDEIHNQVSGEKLHITPRKGEYCLMDKKIGPAGLPYDFPDADGHGKRRAGDADGSRKPDGWGRRPQIFPTNEGVDTTAEGLDEVLKKAALSVKSLPRGVTITSLCGTSGS